MRLNSVAVVLISFVIFPDSLNCFLSAQQLPQEAEATCNVTIPAALVAGASEVQPGSYGNQLLSVGPFGLWPNGTVVFKPNGPGFVTRDNALGMKFGWTRGIRGTLSVTGHRIDGTAPPLRVDVKDGYGDIGFQASFLIFPTPGCWEVTAKLGEREDSTITFVTRVVKIGEGPPRWDPPHH
jgi:hypothetical protein